MSVAAEAIRTGERDELRGELGAAVTTYERLLASGEPDTVAEAHFRLGRVAWRQGRYDDALAHYSASSALATSRGLVNLEARVENGIGAVHYARGAYAQARASYGRAQELASDDPALRGKVFLNLGVIANIEGNLDAARAEYARSEAAFAEAGDDAGRALVLHNLGMINADLELWDEAAESYAACLLLCERQGNKQMVANVLLNQSELQIAAGRHELAVVHCERAMIIYADLGDEPGRGDALRSRSRAHRMLGRLDEAAADATEALRSAIRLEARLLEAEATRELGLIERDRRRDEAAAALLDRALALFTALGAAREVRELRAEIEASG